MRTSQEFLEASWATAAVGGAAPVDLGAAAYKELLEVREHAAAIGLPWWSVSPFTSDEDLEDDAVVLAERQPTAYRGETERAVQDVRRWLADGWRVVLTTQGHGPAQRLVEVLSGEDLPVRLVERLDAAPEPGVVHVTTGCLDTGFESGLLKTVVLTESDLTGTRGLASKDASTRMPSRRRNAVDPLQLKPGDPVVHDQHGVGRYVEMVQRTVQGATREYLILEYAPGKKGQPGDRLFVPTDQLELVTRYVGGEAPGLDKLGGGDWAKRKGRAKKAVKEIAAGLIQLYSARMSAPGHAFGPDTPWQRELEDAFPYVETPGPAVGDRRGQGRHGEAVADGPRHRGRRRLRQDRDRGPRGVQGGAGRQAGRRPGADDAARAAAPRHVPRPLRAVPGDRPRDQPVQLRQGAAGGRRRASPTAPSTSSSARTGCCPRARSSRTWAW